MNDMTRYAIPRFYYWVTPVFVLLDYVWGINVRVAVLDAALQQKNLYYGFCVVCGVVMFLWPQSTPLVALGESAINVLMTALAILLPYMRNLQQVATIDGDWKAAETFGVEGVTNLLMSGVIAAIAFHQSLNVIGRACGSRGPGSKPAGPFHNREM
jgi:hypothetical protein